MPISNILFVILESILLVCSVSKKIVLSSMFDLCILKWRQQATIFVGSGGMGWAATPISNISPVIFNCVYKTNALQCLICLFSKGGNP